MVSKPKVFYKYKLFGFFFFSLLLTMQGKSQPGFLSKWTTYTAIINKMSSDLQGLLARLKMRVILYKYAPE